MSRIGLEAGVPRAWLVPYVYLSCRAVFARQLAAAIEAARLLGERSAGVFFRVALPMARPAIVAGGSLVVMESMNDYGVVILFGLMPLMPGVFRAWGEGEVVVAMRLALFLMLFLSLVLMLERWQRGKQGFGESGVTGKLRRERLGWLNNPHFPALQSDRLALSGASRRKQSHLAARF